MTEIKNAPANFDLAASNFPPLPGGVAGVLPGGAGSSAEAVLENRMADVVKGINRDKVRNYRQARLCICLPDLFDGEC